MDTISRQEAIDALGERPIIWSNDDEYSLGARNQYDTDKLAIETVPSAQPDIIRCEDCKWYGRADKRRFYRGMDCLQKRIDTIVPDKDFCSKAERRTDE